MKIRSNVAVLAAAILMFTGLATAQGVYTPEKGSPERTAILGALRVPVERSLKQKVVFVTDTFNVKGNWAFIAGRPQQPDGNSPDYSATPYADQGDAFDNNIFALLKKANGKWRVVKYAIGCTDVCYMEWDKTYKAPRDIFGFGD